MKKNIVLNKYYRNLRENIFSDLDIKEFMNVYTNFKRLSIQYRFLQCAKFLEKVNIPKIDMPIIRFFS